MKRILSLIFFVLTISVIPFFLSACAYKLSAKSESMPGKISKVQIPLFINNTAEPLVETLFTNSLVAEALKSKVVVLQNNESNSEAVLQGSINSIDILSAESVVEAKNTQYLPSQTVNSIQYVVAVVVKLELKKRGSSEVIWSGTFKQSKNYSAPQLTLPVINTSNSLYNQSAKRQTLDVLSKEMMQAAFDRMLENF